MSYMIALAGNPNCGKTSLFNELTGSRQRVGNWPGVTVDKKEGTYKKDKEIEILDLPGTYSLSPYSAEEIIARNYLVKEKPDAVINIVDGTSLERNLYLTLQILETGIPTVIALNMMDEVTAGGGTKNRTWMQIICDMAGIPITIPEPWQCSSYGDAMLAAVGCGALKDFLALRDALPQGTVLQPNLENHEFYKTCYPIFRELYRANRESMYALQDNL